MTDFPRIVLALVGISFSAVLIGGSFAFGVATVCRWMKWAPVNTIINVNDYRTIISSDAVGREQQP